MVLTKIQFIDQLKSHHAPSGGGKLMAENKYVLKALSTYTGKENTLYQKEFDTRELAEMYRDILEPVLKKAQADNPVLPYVTYIIEEFPEG
jgi:hypothetical protein